MTFEEILDQAVAMLRRQGRVSYRALARQFGLDDKYLDDLKFEITQVLRVGRDQDEQMLVWTGDAGRRQLTVMFCDLVDSTDLSSRLDPEDLREVIRAYHQASVAVIQRLGGHVAQYLGDGVLVYFGYPHAHEDDPQRAVRSGLEILDAVQDLNARPDGAVRLSVRVGIHTGPVVVGEMGAGGRHEQLALGETPNIAARLQGLAEPDTVVISDATYRLVQGYFACDGRGAHALKGIPRPVAVHQVLRESGARGRVDAARAGGLTPLVGRASQFALLVERWGEATAGRGQAVLVSGEPGIGKSRLVHELKDHVASDGGACIEFLGSPYHQHSTWHPILDHVERRLGFRRGDPPEERLAKLEGLLAAHRLPLPEILPLLAPLFSLPLPDRYAPPRFTPEKKRQKTQEALVAWILESAAARPLLVVCEDLHWADPSTLELLRVLVDRAPEARMVVVATSRPEFDPSWIAAAHLTLERFTGAQVAEMVGVVSGASALSPDVVRRVVEKTDGVPLFVEELTKMLLESDPSAPLEIPATLQDSLMARLDRLTTGKSVAQLGAVVGREFADDVLRAVSPWDEATLQRGLGELVEAELVHRRGAPPSLAYVFKHALIQDTAYQSLLRSTRRQYHGRIGAVLAERFPETAESQPELLAHHFAEGGRHPEAIEYLDRANDKATRANALVEALRYFEDATRLLDGQPESAIGDRRRLALLIRQVTVFRGLFRYPEYHALLERHEALAARVGDAGLRAAMDARLGHCEYAVGEYDRAIARLKSAAAACEAHGRSEDAALAYMAWAWAAMYKGDHQEAIAVAGHAVRVTDGQFHLQYRVWARVPRSVCLTYLGRWDEAIAESNHALADADRYDDDGCRVMAWMPLSLAHTLRGDPEGGAEYARRALDKAPTPVERSVALFGLGTALCLGSGPREGIEMVAPLVAMARAAKHRSVEVLAVVLGEGYLRAGDLEAARAALEEALELCETYGMKYAAGRAHRALGELALAQNPAQAEPPLAAPALERALSIFRATGAQNDVALTEAAYGRLLKRQGRFADARDRLASALETFERLGTLAEPDRARAELAELPVAG